MVKDLIDSLVTLVKPDGTVIENIPAHVQSKLIIITDETIPIEIGDHLLRKLNNGLSDDFIVENYSHYDHKIMGMDSHAQIKVRRSGSPTNQATIIHNITNTNNNINNTQHGDHSKINVQSTDNSQNKITTISSTQLKKFVDEVTPVLGQLPDGQRQIIEVKLTTLEQESAKAEPSQMKTRGALQAIKSAAEGAAGNLVATGIISLITSIF
ncbi:hypothetical protein [Loktanella sp. SALINAS62]|uniref:hypothetical protein n=1 Tax=Loktanella sp. SALINAS62 TaxID=2706124 RepID=UPI001B8CC61B|nr:hypothetical protein [Loktanella sp. SALINAS62]MBS1303429.1 succinylglutamate desuccinylase [Loktanella sp. SALINAS62]